eukprot:TRINITY_DN25650_c0_g1_i1.p2 TRINITY_DN25650_c0_g1~~TRINITY_DN25650_c0_g1_i1.p2  ORF type:complete len:147 (-),score=67.04 TRINITY_DN25650_c0_g1_i1:210-650(-)
MAQRFNKATEEVRDYVEEHDLEKTITQLVNVLVTLRPKEPKSYMARWMLEHCDQEQKKDVKLEIVKELEEPDQKLLDKSLDAYRKDRKRRAKIRQQAKEREKERLAAEEAALKAAEEAAMEKAMAAVKEQENLRAAELAEELAKTV